MPIVFTTDGQQHLEFVPTPNIKESMDKGGQPVRLGDVLALLRQSADTIQKQQAEIERLKVENEKLWKVAMKDAPQPQPPTVVVQQPAPQPSPLDRYMVLRSLFMPTQPYQLPMPVNPNANRLRTNCTTNTIGTVATTTCN